jgi:hypothetical protein
MYDPELIAIYSVNEYANLIHSEVSCIIDHHAPLLTSAKVLITTDNTSFFVIHTFEGCMLTAD